MALTVPLPLMSLSFFFTHPFPPCVVTYVGYAHPRTVHLARHARVGPLAASVANGLTVIFPPFDP